MSKNEDGGPAFPITSAAAYQFCGISMLDWFACHATEQDIAEHRVYGPASLGGTSREEARYRFAAAMLSARTQGDGA